METSWCKSPTGVSQRKHGNVRADCPPGCCYEKIQLMAVIFLHSPGSIQSWTKCFKAHWFALRTKQFGGLASSPEHLFHSQLWCPMRGTGQELVCRHWNNPASKSKGIDGSDVKLCLLTVGLPTSWQMNGTVAGRSWD